VKTRHVIGVAAVAVVVLGSGTAYAANGGNLLLGRSNTATRATTVANSGGVPLALVARAGYPPLAVNSAKKVTRLNADLLDGLDSSRFALTSGRTGHIAASSGPVDVDGNGTLDTLLAVASCPAGSSLTGGGGQAVGVYDLYLSAPWAVRQWAAAASYDPTQGDLPTDVTAYAICYNPRGAVPGATALSAASSRAQLMATLKAKLARR
jgi:hypothetical protein